MSELISVTIDGYQISVPKGTLLIRAAEMLGIQIPRFCDHPLLDPAGACRQCLVEVSDMGNGRGMPKPAASCTTTVMPGMVIKTQLTSPIADKAQQGVMELLLINHPLDCPVCDKGGECPLQNQAMSNGRAESRFVETKRTFAKPVAISTNVLLDRERCVLCQRCTRFSEQIAGDPFIDLLERGAAQQIGIADDVPFQSYFSGNTVQICPVGALTGASYRFRARPFDLLSQDSVCEHCSSGCAQRTDFRRGKVTRRLAGEDPEVNEEWNCDKGRWAFHNATQADRLLTPLVRTGAGVLVEASWPEALERAADGLRSAGSAGVLPGGRLSEEDAYAYAKFARVVLGTNDVDFRARPHSDEELDFLASAVAGRSVVSYRDLDSAPAVLLVGFEPEEESPIVFLRLRKAVRNHATPIFTVAPFLSGGARKLGATLVPALPGAEAAAVGAFDADLAGAVILVGERAASSPGTLSAVAALGARTGARVAWVPRRAGDRGALDAGAVPTLLPGGRPVADAAARAEVQAVWGTSVPAGRGRDLGAILAAAASGELGALVVGGVDPADLADQATALAGLDRAFVVSLEVRRSAVTDRADVVLPVAPAAEKAGRYVTWEGRRRPFDLTLRGTGALSDARVLHALSEELESEIHLPSFEAARAELDALGAGSARPPAPAVSAPSPVAIGDGQAVLATWTELLDAGRMQDGEPNLAGTAKPARALLSAATALRVGVVTGDLLSVSTGRGAVVVPVVVDALLDDVVWLPTNARGCAVRATLGAAGGDLVELARSEAPPVIAADPASAAAPVAPVAAVSVGGA